MDLLKEYFNFRIRYVVEYCKLLMGDTIDNELRDDCFYEYISTYVNAYYLESFGTIEDKERLKVKYDDVVKELKGKAYELVYEIQKKKMGKDKEDKAKDMVSKTFSFASVGVILDLKDYSSCELMTDYEIAVKSTLEKNKKIVNISSAVFDKLVRLVRKNKKATEDYLKEIKSKNFFLDTILYRGCTDKEITKLHFDIKGLSSQKKFVVDKVFESEDVYKEKIIQKINLINELLLNKILKREKINYYFLNIPLEYVSSKQVLDVFFKMIDNPISKKYIVLILNYKYYTNKRMLFKDYEEYKYALYVDLSRVKDINAKLEELEELPLFNYIIFDNVRDEDRRLVTEYEMKGKEMFQNSYDYDGEDE